MLTMRSEQPAGWLGLAMRLIRNHRLHSTPITLKLPLSGYIADHRRHACTKKERIATYRSLAKEWASWVILVDL